MDDIRFYLSIFLRRLPWFLVVSTVITAIAVIVAVSLPPAYVSQMRLVVESPQIPTELAVSTVRTPALEHLQIVEQRLLTRANLLEIARNQGVLPDIGDMTPDEIVRAMRARTSLDTNSPRGGATTMTISFEASSARIAAAVMNDYLTIIQEADAEFRRGRAGETLEFFAQEVMRLDEELAAQSARIISFKQENTDALPESLNFRLSKREDLQRSLTLTEREIVRLQSQRKRLQELFEATGEVVSEPEPEVLSPAERKLRQLESELAEALLVFSEENPKVRLLRRRIDLLKAEIEGEIASPPPPGGESTGTTEPSVLDIQIAEIDSEIEVLEERAEKAQAQIEALNETIERTPAIAIALEELERTYALLQSQYNAAEGRLSAAQTGELIESRSRGQRIAVIEQPNVPSSPTKPNRVMIAGGGGFLGIAAGLGLVLILELLNNSVRRPEDLVKRFGISPFTTIPYIRTRRQLFLQRGLKLVIILAILVGIPAAIYTMHVYYLPVDLVAEKVMNRIGVRW